MSLFDLIRCPISDIYSPGQLSHVPQYILVTWVELCAIDAHLDLKTYLFYTHAPAPTSLIGMFTIINIIRACIKQKITEHNLRSMNTSNILTEFDVKDRYTKMLRDLVYENEYYED